MNPPRQNPKPDEGHRDPPPFWRRPIVAGVLIAAVLAWWFPVFVVVAFMLACVWATRWRRLVMVVMLVWVFPMVLVVAFKLAFGWVIELGQLMRSPDPLLLPAAIWWTLGGVILTAAVLWGLGRFAPAQPAGEAVAGQSSQPEGRRGPAGRLGNCLLAVALVVVLAGLTIWVRPVMLHGRDVGRVAGRIDSQAVGRSVGRSVENAFELFIPVYGRVVPRPPEKKAVMNARQLALAVRLSAQGQQGAAPAMLVELVEQGEIEDFLLVPFAEYPLSDPPMVLLQWGRLPEHAPDLPLLVRPMPRLLGGYVVALVDASITVVPEEEWQDRVDAWVPRLEEEGVRWPPTLR